MLIALAGSPSSGHLCHVRGLESRTLIYYNIVGVNSLLLIDDPPLGTFYNMKSLSGRVVVTIG